jgi:hypothetical protein
VNNTWIKKWLVFPVILLFLGAIITPSINYTTVKAADDNDTVEVTTQACGIQGYGNTTVKLTREQYQNLEQYLVEFRARLNQTSTREEAIPIFKNAVLELDKYGLLPKGMCVERAQRLVSGLFQNPKLMKHLERLMLTSGRSSQLDGNELCSIYGEARGNTIFQGSVSRVTFYFFNTLGEHCSYYFITLLLFLLSIIPNVLSFLSSGLLRDRAYLGATIYYGFDAWFVYPGSEVQYSPAQGYLWTNGTQGVKNWSGPFYGSLPSLKMILGAAGIVQEYFPGVNGFIGLRLYFNHTDFYFGHALQVNVSPGYQ